MDAYYCNFTNASLWKQNLLQIADILWAIIPNPCDVIVTSNFFHMAAKGYKQNSRQKVAFFISDIIVRKGTSWSRLDT